MKTAVIVNPRAAGGRLAKRWPALEREVRSALGESTVYFTRGPGDGIHQCRAALAEGATLIVAMGGDGTSSEVAAGLIQAGAGPDSGVAFSFLPCGTGRDLRRTIESPEEVGAAARAIAGAAARPIDAGRLDYLDHAGNPGRSHFINVASFGIAGLGDRLVNKSKRLGVKATYFGAALRATLQYRNARVAVRLDEGPERELTVYNLAVANGRYFGGGMQIAPHAKMDDGVFDVVTMGDLSLFEALGLTGALYKGQHLGRPKIEHARARTITVRPLVEGEVIHLDCDGENPGRLPATFTLLPRALLLRV